MIATSTGCSAPRTGGPRFDLDAQDIAALFQKAELFQAFQLFQRADGPAGVGRSAAGR
jgi:hypothetical protein